MEETAAPAAPASQSSIPDPLEAEFRALSDECVAACLAQVAADAKVSEKLVKVYLSWRGLRGTPFMAQLHQEEGFSLPDYHAAAPDFVPFTKITFRLGLQRTPEDKKRLAQMNSGTRRNKQTGYVASLVRLHAEYEEHRRRYASDPYEQLLAFHEEAGGIEGAREWRVQQNVQPTSKKRKGVALVALNNSVSIHDRARQWIDDNVVAKITKITILSAGRKTKVGAVQFSADGRQLTVLGRYGLRAFDIANDNLRNVVRQSAAHFEHIDPPLLRLFAEVARTQLYPRAFAPAGSRLDPSSPYSLWDQKLSGSNLVRLFMIDGHSLTLSPSDEAGLITVVTTQEPLFPVLLWSRSGTLEQVEEALDQGALAGMTVSPVAPMKLGSGVFGMRLIAKAGDRCKSHKPVLLKFDDTGVGSPPLQPTLDLQNFVARWSFSAAPEWFRGVRKDFFEPWSKNQGAPNRITRVENRRFGIRVDHNTLGITFEIDSAGNGPIETIALGNSSSTKARLRHGPGFCDVMSHDVVRVFCAIPDLPVKGHVSVEGDDHLILLTFATDIGNFQIGIPSVLQDKKKLVYTKAHMTTV
ncbi:MAG: hypothetical protein J0H78_04950 [Rhizobiales bacterium]|nr:hypothetical protein [Hyphomicrobiales bacterium]